MPVAQRLARRNLVVVERVVEAELAQPGDLLGRARAADHPAALQLRDLTDDGADRAGRAGDEHRLALLRPADVEQPDVRGQARHPEHTEPRRDGRERGVEGEETASVRERQLPPAEVVHDPRSLREAAVARGDRPAPRRPRP